MFEAKGSDGRRPQGPEPVFPWMANLFRVSPAAKVTFVGTPE